MKAGKPALLQLIRIAPLADAMRPARATVSALIAHNVSSGLMEPATSAQPPSDLKERVVSTSLGVFGLSKLQVVSTA